MATLKQPIKRTINEKLKRLKRNASQRNIEVNITKIALEELLDISLCYYCGVELDKTNRMKLNGFTIDRLDNNEGYTRENTVAACHRCNIIKGNWFSGEEMLELAENYLQGREF